MSHPQQAEKIKKLFGGIAQNYDKANRLLSFGLDGYWRASLAKQVRRKTTGGILDLATGSGRVILALKKVGCVELVGVDFCQELLNIAKEQAGESVNFVQGDCLNLPFEEGQFEAATLAFALRNFESRARGYKEARRVLKKGGWLFVLEFSTPFFYLRPFHRFYLKHCMPFLGGILTGDRAAWRYLSDSVLRFPTARELAGEMETSGFSHVHFSCLSCGIVTCHLGQKC